MRRTGRREVGPLDQEGPKCKPTERVRKETSIRKKEESGSWQPLSLRQDSLHKGAV